MLKKYIALFFFVVLLIYTEYNREELNSYFNKSDIQKTIKKESEKEEFFNEKLYLKDLREDGIQDIISIYRSGRVRYLRSYNGKYEFGDRDLSLEIEGMVNKFKIKLNICEEKGITKELKTEIYKLMYDIKVYIVASKLSKNLSNEEKEKIYFLEKTSWPLYKKFWKMTNKD